MGFSWQIKQLTYDENLNMKLAKTKIHLFWYKDTFL